MHGPGLRDVLRQASYRARQGARGQCQVGTWGTYLSSMDDERGTAPVPPLVTRTPGESRRGAAAKVRKQMRREMRQHFTATGVAD